MKAVAALAGERLWLREIRGQRPTTRAVAAVARDNGAVNDVDVLGSLPGRPRGSDHRQRTLKLTVDRRRIGGNIRSDVPGGGNRLAVKYWLEGPGSTACVPALWLKVDPSMLRNAKGSARLWTRTGPPVPATTLPGGSNSSASNATHARPLAERPTVVVPTDPGAADWDRRRTPVARLVPGVRCSSGVCLSDWSASGRVVSWRRQSNT